jgi:hypothetical protein
LNTAVIAATGITALVAFLFLAEWDGLTESHARPWAHILNAARWGCVIALCWALIWAAFSAPAPQRTATLVGLAALTGALMLVPVRWFVRVAGRDPIWELRWLRVEVTLLTNAVRRGAGSVPPGQLRNLIDRLDRAYAPETAELCNLLAAEVQDLLAGDESWNEAGRRTIRIDELCRGFWPDDMPPPDFDAGEATFRWRLYRAFGQLMDAGVATAGTEERDEFARLLSSLDGFRRPDTRDLIRDIRRSGKRWLADRMSKRPWIEAFDFSVLGPHGLEEVRQMWGRDSALWGAELEEDDRRALEADVARRASVSES